MRALSIHQPYTALIMLGINTNEHRWLRKSPPGISRTREAVYHGIQPHIPQKFVLVLCGPGVLEMLSR